MKARGLIHGMSSVATADFYQRVNNLAGGHERPEMLISSAVHPM